MTDGHSPFYTLSFCGQTRHKALTPTVLETANGFVDFLCKYQPAIITAQPTDQRTQAQTKTTPPVLTPDGLGWLPTLHRQPKPFLDRSRMNLDCRRHDATERGRFHPVRARCRLTNRGGARHRTGRDLSGCARTRGGLVVHVGFGGVQRIDHALESDRCAVRRFGHHRFAFGLIPSDPQTHKPWASTEYKSF